MHILNVSRISPKKILNQLKLHVFHLSDCETMTCKISHQILKKIYKVCISLSFVSAYINSRSSLSHFRVQISIIPKLISGRMLLSNFSCVEVVQRDGGEGSRKTTSY